MDFLLEFFILTAIPKGYINRMTGFMPDIYVEPVLSPIRLHCCFCSTKAIPGQTESLFRPVARNGIS